MILSNIQFVVLLWAVHFAEQAPNKCPETGQREGEVSITRSIMDLTTCFSPFVLFFAGFLNELYFSFQELEMELFRNGNI